MAEVESTPEERTEAPTERRMAEYRKVGDLPLSMDVTIVASIIFGFYCITLIGSKIQSALAAAMVVSFRAIEEHRNITLSYIAKLASDLLAWVAPTIIIITAVLSVVGIFSVMLQTNWNIKPKLVDFRWNVLNPIQGLRRVLSVQSAINTIKAILKLIILLPIGIYSVYEIVPSLAVLMMSPVQSIQASLAKNSIVLVWRLIAVLIIIAVFDFIYGRHRWLRDHRMTKIEVKEERKAVEGDEATRREIVAKGIRRVRQRLTKTVPSADVVITNPTHYAVALQYKSSLMKAPKVVAKGQDEMALRIREIAREHNVPIVERRELARTLYRDVKVGSEIPHYLFRAVAEVLGFVYARRKRSSTEVFGS